MAKLFVSLILLLLSCSTTQAAFEEPSAITLHYTDLSYNNSKSTIVLSLILNGWIIKDEQFDLGQGTKLIIGQNRNQKDSYVLIPIYGDSHIGSAIYKTGKELITKGFDLNAL